ncbi:MAG: type II/IV secretion system protein [Verrucomicrobiaceae bacterium]|nr:type II/IV secretion system protein [Verrucomicrobiaceae bacterium]
MPALLNIPNTAQSASKSFGEASSPSAPNIDNRPAAILSIEGLALQHNMIPLTLLRESCSPEAERMVRKLGRVPYVADPWLPITTLGPLLVMAHHNPRAGDLWGVPPFLVIKVLITAEQYQNTRKELVQRFGQMPINQSNTIESLQPANFKELGLEGTYQWLLAHYPYEPSEITKLNGFYEAQKGKADKLAITHFNVMQRNLGIALQHLVSGGKQMVFSAAEAQRQNHFPLPLLERHCVYPIYIGKNVVFMLSDSGDCYRFEDEWVSMGHPVVKIVPVLADLATIRDAINRAGATFDKSGVADMESVTLSVVDDANVVEIYPDDMNAINPQAQGVAPEDLVKWALYTAIRCRASDLHLEKFYSFTRFRARMDGCMKTILTAHESQLNRFVALIKNWAGMSQTRAECQDGRLALSIGKRRVDVRIAAVPTRREFQKVIMRFLDKQDGVKRLSDFNLGQRQIDILTRTMQRDQGLVLVTGPTGSGKTTTLYALLNSVNDEGVNIQTIEDPIEYEIEGINQTQTNNSRGLDFANGLRSLLRADPDIILIGESRDAETAGAAVNAALTGHLVLTTLHANDSLRAITRLLSMGVEKYLLSDSIALSQAQRLARRLCTYCKQPIPVPQEVQELLAKQQVITAPVTTPIFQARGCDECHNTGYSGRVALMEICEVSTELRDLIEEAAPMSAMRAAAFKTGFRSLYQEGLVQVLAGHTSLDEIKCLSYTAM